VSHDTHSRLRGACKSAAAFTALVSRAKCSERAGASGTKHRSRACPRSAADDASRANPTCADPARKPHSATFLAKTWRRRAVVSPWIPALRSLTLARPGYESGARASRTRRSGKSDNEREADQAGRPLPIQLRFGLPTKPRPWPAAWAAQPPATRPLKIDGPSMVPSRPARPLMWPPAMPATSPAA